MQPVLVPLAYFPPVSLLSQLARPGATTVVGSRYTKQTVRNRCLLLGPNGVMRLTVPVKAYGNNAVDTLVVIDDTQNWRNQHWRSLTSAYRNSPYFEYFEDALRKVILPEVRQEMLIDLAQSSTETTLQLLGLNGELSVIESTAVSSHDAMDLIQTWNADPRPFATELSAVPYQQVWADRFAFEPDLSGLDLLCCMGPRGQQHLLR